jgi:hypothetical protein
MCLIVLQGSPTVEGRFSRHALVVQEERALKRITPAMFIGDPIAVAVFSDRALDELTNRKR